ncbi:MAG: ABC transporter ATP-binding protein [Myxococcota bacterium]
MLRKEPEDTANAIECRGLGICYRHYRKKSLTLKESAVRFFRNQQFESFWALRKIDLDVRKGESVGIIGKNGSGKSTLLKAVCGVLRPSRGTVASRGRIAPLLELGGGFHQELTGRENIFMNGAIMGLSKKEVRERIERIIEFSGLGEFIDVPLHNYSSGMRARLGFAVSTEVDAEILVLDEVLAVGDAEFHARAVARTENFFRSNHTVILVSHQLGTVKRLCERCVWISKGEIQADGPADEVIKQYQKSVRGD